MLTASPVLTTRLRYGSTGGSAASSRLKNPANDLLITQLSEELRDRRPRSTLKFADGKPLVVSGFSKDHDATLGKVPDVQPGLGEVGAVRPAHPHRLRRQSYLRVDVRAVSQDGRHGR
jgi:hypothetical protein